MSTILVVEDDASTRELLVRRLEAEQYIVLTAIDGIEALIQTRNMKPDLVILDIGLPKLDGWQVARRLKAIETTRVIPIIVLNAYAMQEDRQRSLALGCEDYQAKPIDFAQLLTKISYWLQVSMNLKHTNASTLI